MKFKDLLEEFGIGNSNTFTHSTIRLAANRNTKKLYKDLNTHISCADNLIITNSRNLLINPSAEWIQFDGDVQILNQNETITCTFLFNTDDEFKISYHVTREVNILEWFPKVQLADVVGGLKIKEGRYVINTVTSKRNSEPTSPLGFTAEGRLNTDSFPALQLFGLDSYVQVITHFQDYHETKLNDQKITITSGVLDINLTDLSSVSLSLHGSKLVATSSKGKLPYWIETAVKFNNISYPTKIEFNTRSFSLKVNLGELSISTLLNEIGVEGMEIPALEELTLKNNELTLSKSKGEETLIILQAETANNDKVDLIVLTVAKQKGFWLGFKPGNKTLKLLGEETDLLDNVMGGRLTKDIYFSKTSLTNSTQFSKIEEKVNALLSERETALPMGSDRNGSLISTTIRLKNDRGFLGFMQDIFELDKDLPVIVFIGTDKTKSVEVNFSTQIDKIEKDPDNPNVGKLIGKVAYVKPGVKKAINTTNSSTSTKQVKAGYGVEGTIELPLFGKPYKFNLGGVKDAGGYSIHGLLDTSAKQGIKFRNIELKDTSFKLKAGKGLKKELAFSSTMTLPNGEEGYLGVVTNPFNPFLWTVIGSVPNLSVSTMVNSFTSVKIDSTFDFIKLEGNSNNDVQVPDAYKSNLLHALKEEEDTAVPDILNDIDRKLFKRRNEVTILSSKNADVYNFVQSDDMPTYWHYNVKKGILYSDLKFYYAPERYSFDGDRFVQGFFFDGSVNVLKKTLNVKAEINVEKGVAIKGDLEQIVLLNDKIFSIGHKNRGSELSICTYKRPEVKDPLFSKPHAYIDASVTLLGASSKVLLVLSHSGATFQLKSNLFKFIKTELNVTANGSKVELSTNSSLNLPLNSLGIKALKKSKFSVGYNVSGLIDRSKASISIGAFINDVGFNFGFELTHNSRTSFDSMFISHLVKAIIFEIPRLAANVVGGQIKQVKEIIRRVPKEATRIARRVKEKVFKKNARKPLFPGLRDKISGALSVLTEEKPKQRSFLNYIISGANAVFSTVKGYLNF